MIDQEVDFGSVGVSPEMKLGRLSGRRLRAENLIENMGFPNGTDERRSSKHLGTVEPEQEAQEAAASWVTTPSVPAWVRQSLVEV